MTDPTHNLPKSMSSIMAGRSYTKKKTKQTWEGVDVVDYFAKHFPVPKDGPWGYAAWLGKVKRYQVKMYHAEKLIEIMKKREQWIKEKGEVLHRGKWMFNRFKIDIKEQGLDKFISSNL